MVKSVIAYIIALVLTWAIALGLLTVTELIVKEISESKAAEHACLDAGWPDYKRDRKSKKYYCVSATGAQSVESLKK